MSNNPIKASDLYQDDGAINEAIKQLELLKKSYTDNLDAITKEAEKLIDKLAQVNTTQKEGQETTRKAMTDAEKLKRAQKEYATALNDTNSQIRALKQAKREDIKMQQLQNKLAKSAVGSYNQLSAQYSINKLKLNAMSKAERSATASGKALEKQTRDIYEEMNRLQKATGKHTLQVGNYGIATENLHPLLGRLNMQLGAMGTSIGALGKSDKPFKVLTTAVLNFGKATLAFMLTPIGMILTAVGALFYLISSNKDTVIEFNSGLIDVGKTANLSGEELRGLGQDIVDLSRKLKVIGTPALLEYAKVAGQLGVKGRENILLFTESLAKLETASDIAGDEGASKIARLLTLTDGGVQNIESFGDEIVNLGNNFAATENEILTNATAIAQNTGQYNIGRKSVLAYATATKAVGLEAELTGSTIGRTLGLMEKAIRTGKNVDALAQLTGMTVEGLKEQFKEDPAAVFGNFIQGLNNVNQAGGSVNAQMEQLGITSIRDQRVVASLATKGYDVLAGSLETVNDAAGSLDKEFGAASSKLDAQFSRIGIAWDNFILTIEDGEGVIATVASFLAGEFAKSIDRASFFIKVMGAVITGVIAVFKQYFKEVGNFIESIKKIADVEIDFSSPIKSLKNIKAAFANVKNTAVQGGKNMGKAFTDAFTAELSRADKATKDALAGSQDEFNKQLDKTIKGGLKTVGQIDKEIKDLRTKLQGASSREQAKAIQDDIKALEKKKDAILGVVGANLKERESRAAKKQQAVVDVMQDSENKDLAILDIELKEKRKLWAEYGLDVNLLDEYENRRRFEIGKKWSDKAIADAKAADDLIAKNKKEAASKNRADFSAGMEAINQQQDLANSEIDLLQETEAEKTRLRLEAEKARLLAVLKLNEKIEGQLSALQVATIKNTIKKIEGEIATAGQGQQDIYSMVGLKLDDEQKAAVSESLSFAMDNVRAFMEARVQAAEVAVQAAQEETSAAENRYQAEITARNNGYANNVLTAQRELELKKKNEAAALKEKEKAQKAQAAIDTAMQISGLITASVNIWKSLSAIPIVGTALAVAAVGVMWASYAASKIKAKSAAKEKYGDGGLEFLDGGSHSSGNDIPIGTTRSGKQRTAEGGEAMAIINKKQTRKYKGVLPNIIKSLNAGTFEQTYANAFIPAEQMPPLVNVGYDSPDLKQIENDLTDIRKRGEVQRYTDSNGNMVEVYKNVKTTFV
ncbi:tail length tape measure protein [Croceibacter phage P2559S]|uniref:tail length tape measure protein n=1 Tax=Croceibacter phage P2559S TaxID=1176422 RepID=UPI0002688EB1|nr:tail length tape measure protein [Croceibacter phage P2559S]AFM54800.1 phage tail length tape-measure protein [Croceibacter phage P2559S]